MRLYFTPGACSLAPHIVGREAALNVELVKVDLATRRTEDGGDYLAVNPKGQVPALVLDDGRLLTEAAVILQYLADLAPGAGLVPPPGSAGRYVVQEWLNFIATELHKGFAPLWHKETPAEARRQAKDLLAARLAFLDRHLAGRPYIAGERFGIADAYAFAILGWTGIMGIDLSRWPSLVAFRTRIAARPQVHAALVREGLAADAGAAA